MTGAPSRTSKRPSRLQLVRPRRDEVRAAECRKEVVQSHVVRQVKHAEAQTQLVLVGSQQVVDPQAEIKQVPWRNARRIVQWVAGAGRWNNESACCDALGRAARETGCRRRG